MDPLYKIRLATKADAPALLKIYAPSVLLASTSFEVELPTVREFESRIDETLKRFPWLVYESLGEVVGYAYASPHRARSAYNWSLESTVYVKESHHKKGIARTLCHKLFSLLKGQGAVNVFAGITLPNEASVRLHESLGFVSVAVFRDVGFKLNKWWDVGWWQLQVQRPLEPGALRPYSFEQ